MAIQMDLSPNDSLWLNMDSPENLMVIESVLWFDHRLDPDRVKRDLLDRVVNKYPVFRWRPVFTEGVGDKDQWEDDAEFNIDNHVTVHELPGAGGREELQDFLESQMKVPIPRNRPIWRAHILEGNEFGAIMIRFHHAIADGTALARVLIEMTSETPDEDGGPIGTLDRIHPAEPPAPAEEVPTDRVPRSLRNKAVNAVTQAATLPVAAGLKATNATSKLLHMLDPDEDGSLVSKIADQAIGTSEMLEKLLVATPPDVLFFGNTVVDKRADWGPAHDLAAVKRAAKSQGATVNDLMLAAVAGGLRRYLEKRGDNIADLVTMIPVNLRPIDKPMPPHLGNRFALVALNLALEPETALERLQVTKARMDVIKAGPEAMLTFGISTSIGYFGTVTATATRKVVEYFGNKAIGVTTNVPGPQMPRYFAGQRVVGILGWVPGAARQSLGVCIFSFDGQIRVGFKTDMSVVPDVANLVACYAEEIEELLKLGA